MIPFHLTRKRDQTNSLHFLNGDVQHAVIDHHERRADLEIAGERTGAAHTIGGCKRDQQHQSEA